MTASDTLDIIKADLLKKLAAFGIDKDATTVTLEDALDATGQLLDRLRAHLEGTGKMKRLEDLKAEVSRHTQFLEQRSRALDRFREVDAAPNAAREAQLTAVRSAVKSTPFLALRPSLNSVLPVLYLLYRVQQAVEAQAGDAATLSKLSLIVRHLESLVNDQDLHKLQTGGFPNTLHTDMDLEPVKQLQAEIDRLMRLHQQSQAEIIALKSEVDTVRVQVTMRDTDMVEHQKHTTRLLQEAKDAQERFNQVCQDLEKSRAAAAEADKQYHFYLEESGRFQVELHEVNKKLQKQTDHIRYLETQVDSTNKDIKEKDRELNRLREKQEALLSQEREVGNRSGMSFVRSQTPVRNHATATVSSSYLMTTKAATTEVGETTPSGNQELSGLIDNYKAAAQQLSATFNQHMERLAGAKAEETGHYQQMNRRLAAAQQQLKERVAPTAPLPSSRPQSPLQVCLLGAILLLVGLSYYQMSRGPYNAH